MPFITLTGADDTIQHERLWHIAEASSLGCKNHGNIEWGILYSTSNQGSGRYPSFGWIEKLASTILVALGPSFALHVCGRAVHDFIDGRGHVSEIATAFNRIQLNFNSAEFSINEIRACLRRNPHKIIITQHNKANQYLWATFLDEEQNHAVLFDASCGKGLSPDRWYPAFKGLACGFAGGLGPLNLTCELPRIFSKENLQPLIDVPRASLSNGPWTRWVDMESSLRDAQDRFDLGLAEKCIAIAGEFYDQHITVPRLARLQPA